MSRRIGHQRPDEEDDDEGFTELSSRVKLLKNISIQIGEETREHIKYLKELDEKADSSSGFLSRNMEHVKKLARGGHNNLVFYLIAFALFVMIVIYFINRSLR